MGATKPPYPPEFREQLVALVRSGAPSSSTRIRSRFAFLVQLASFSTTAEPARM